MKKTHIIITCFLMSLNLFGQNKYLKDIDETQALSQKVVNLFATNKTSQSFSELAVYWPLPKKEINQLKEVTVKFMDFAESRYGKPIGTLKVKNETISDIAIQETYLIRYEVTAIRLIFTYYKNDNGWILNGFKWDDLFTEEFGQ